MAIDKLGTNEDPDIKVQGSSVEIVPDTTRDEQIAAAAQILVDDEEILLDQEIQQELAPQMSFDANLEAINNQDLNGKKHTQMDSNT
jgi:hypothetical protein